MYRNLVNQDFLVVIMMKKPATNSSNTGPRPTNCNGSKNKGTKAKVWSSGTHQKQI